MPKGFPSSVKARDIVVELTADSAELIVEELRRTSSAATDPMNSRTRGESKDPAMSNVVRCFNLSPTAASRSTPRISVIILILWGSMKIFTSLKRSKFNNFFKCIASPEASLISNFRSCLNSEILLMNQLLRERDPLVVIPRSWGR